MIVEDNVVAFPALPASGRPWVRIVSCNPTEVRDPDVPPPFSGYAVDDRSGWAAYWDEWARTHGEMHAAFSALCEERGAPPLPELEFMYTSPWLNLDALSRTRPTTRVRERSAAPGTTCRPASAPPTRRGSSRRSWPSARARSSTCRSGRSAAPTSS